MFFKSNLVNFDKINSVLFDVKNDSKKILDFG